jgi:chromosome segregation ATPase
LKCQEDLLVKENEKYLKLNDALAQEKERCKNLTNELKTCDDSISCLKSENANLIVKIEGLNACCWGPSSSEGPQKRNLTMSSKHGL